MESGEGEESVKRRGEWRSVLNDRRLSSLIEECEFGIKPNFIPNADPPVKKLEIGAATHGDMLAVIHHFACGLIRKGGCPTAQSGAFLQQSHPKTVLRQCDGGGKTGNSSANNNDLFAGRTT
jgi:hypothetical protein